MVSWLYNKFFVSILLVISVVLQSFVAIAASVETHQVDIQHIQTKHNHHDDIAQKNNLNTVDGHDVSDCHHCGHCSGSHLSWILVKLTSSHVQLISQKPIPLQIVLPPLVLETAFRPPISFS